MDQGFWSFFWTDFVVPLFKYIFNFYTNQYLLSLYGLIILLYVIFMAFCGWHATNVSAERGVFCCKACFWSAFFIVLTFCHLFIFSHEGIKGFSLIMYLLMMVVIFYFPFFLMRFLLTKIIFVNMLGPFLLLFIMLPYILPLKIHGNLGATKEELAMDKTVIHYH
ncbi:MAG: hypothetical protein K6F92_06135 [Lachnospiraceae bacterium]|nr:hypothetical protein [Lachnospiraceae bacterium]